MVVVLFIFWVQTRELKDLSETAHKCYTPICPAPLWRLRYVEHKKQDTLAGNSRTHSYVVFCDWSGDVKSQTTCAIRMCMRSTGCLFVSVYIIESGISMSQDKVKIKLSDESAAPLGCLLGRAQLSKEHSSVFYDAKAAELIGKIEYIFFN